MTGPKSTIRFAFYGRVSTEDNQDPASSRAWQITRAQALIGNQGEIVAEFFDVDRSRSIPWPRRPQAAALLAAIRQPDRGFDAVVIGEPQRAFYGPQYGLISPVFEHFRVPLWVPEVGGPIDPANEAHDLVMSVFSGISKGERNRIKIRVRSAMTAQVQLEGRYLGGRPPYGYTLEDAGPHPNPSKAADGKRLHRLALDPVAAPVVKRIYRDYLSNHGFAAIAETLTAEGVPCPSAHDPKRNRHRSGRAWTEDVVRIILTNPRYTGYQVWARQRKDEVLIDVDDVTLGHTVRMRNNSEEEWVWSDDKAHPEIVKRAVFDLVQSLINEKDTSRPKTRRRPKRIYVFRGMVFHDGCGRSMHSHARQGTNYYRCRMPPEYATANGIDHPPNVYVREDDLVEQIDRWLARLFSPSRIKATLARIAAEGGGEGESARRLREARQSLAESRRRMGQHRATLEAGADPKLIAEWIAEEQLKQQAAERRVAAAESAQGVAVAEEGPEVVAERLRELGGAVRALGRATPARKQRIYESLRIRLRVSADGSTVRVEPAGEWADLIGDDPRDFATA